VVNRVWCGMWKDMVQQLLPRHPQQGWPLVLTETQKFAY